MRIDTLTAIRTRTSRSFLEEGAGILEFDAGLPRAETELEAARITAAYARNRGYLWQPTGGARGPPRPCFAQVPATPAPWMPGPWV